MDEFEVAWQNIVEEGELQECLRCGKQGAITYRQSTQYVDDHSNWTTLCLVCREENDRYWMDMWTEYYGGVLCG